jgi:membrane protein implicated in regulation of membrane protease activity
MAEVFGVDLPTLLTVGGVLLLVAEALAPGAHFVVLGVALLAAGIVGFALGPAATPLVLAAVVLGAGGAALYGYRRFDIYGGKGSGRTQDSSSLVGREGVVVERVTPTDGQVRLVEGGFDPSYSARSVDGEIAEGTRVMVVDPGGGSILTVESMETDDIDRELERERERQAAETAGDTGEGTDSLTEAERDPE